MAESKMNDFLQKSDPTLRGVALRRAIADCAKACIDTRRFDVFLFGSEATGTAHSDSDIDVGILGTEEVAPKQMLDFREALERLRTLRSFDVVDFAKVTPEFKQHAMKAAVRLKPDDRNTIKTDTRIESEMSNQEKIIQFERAVQRLREALEQPETEFIRDSAIQRFEFSFELAWKSLQALARSQGQWCQTPRQAFQFALGEGWIQDESLWLEMIETRNLTSHTYHEQLAIRVYRRLPRYLEAFESLITNY